MVDQPRWTISFECDTSRLPQSVLETVRAHLEDMGDAIARIEPSNPFWSSLRESGLRIDVGGWRFYFRVEIDSITLVEVQPAI